MGSQYVGNTITTNGNGNFTVDYKGTARPISALLELVE
jgi:hypothetical protein